MSDRCTIRRDDQQEFDDVLDEATGTLTPPDNDSRYVYQGRCLVKPTGRGRGHLTDVGGEQVSERLHDLLIPLDARQIKPNDVVTIDASQRDAQLVGREFVITDVIEATFAVARQAEMGRKI